MNLDPTVLSYSFDPGSDSTKYVIETAFDDARGERRTCTVARRYSMLHKREIGILADADLMLSRLHTHLQPVFTELEELVGAERAGELRHPVAKEVADFKQRRERHIQKCAKRSRNVDSGVGSDSE